MIASCCRAGGVHVLAGEGVRRENQVRAPQSRSLDRGSGFHYSPGPQGYGADWPGWAACLDTCAGMDVHTVCQVPVVPTLEPTLCQQPTSSSRQMTVWTPSATNLDTPTLTQGPLVRIECPSDPKIRLREGRTQVMMMAAKCPTGPTTSSVGRHSPFLTLLYLQSRRRWAGHG